MEEVSAIWRTSLLGVSQVQIHFSHQTELLNGGCWKASSHCCHKQKLSKTNLSFFIPGFGNKRKKKGESYKEKYRSGYGIIDYFYRIFSRFPSCEQFESFTGWHGKNATETHLTLQSSSLPLELAVRVQNLDLIIPTTFPLSLHGTEFPKAIRT